MKSATHSAFGRGTRNWRFTLSRGQGAAGLPIVVFIALSRIAPDSPICRISRAVVQRATAIPSLTDLLLQYPNIGRRTKRPGHSPDEHIGHTYPYLVFYEPTETEIIIHAVRHAARDPSACRAQPKSNISPAVRHGARRSTTS